jgi:hypothetical protein
MRAFLGYLGLVAAVGFEIGLFCSNASFSWYGKYDGAWAGFFGFGIPMILLGLGVGSLWSPVPALLRVFAWASTLSAAVWAAGLFITVARWVGLMSFGSVAKIEVSEGFGQFLAFAIPMLISGIAGIAILLEYDDKRRY